MQDRSRQRTQRVPVLFNGVSGQPPTSRLPNQVKDAGNVSFSVVDGATRRMGSWLQQHLSLGLLPAGDNRMHAIDRDGMEQYIVVHNRTTLAATIRVLELSTNLWANVTVSSEAQAYLNSGSPKNFRFRTIVDNTLIVNTEKELAGAPGPIYAISGQWDTYAIMTSQTPDDDTYHQTVEDAEEPAGYYHYDVDGTTFATIEFAEITGGTWGSPTGDWDNFSGSPRGFRIQFRLFDTGAQTGAVWTQATKRLVKAGAFTGWTYNSGHRLNVQSGTGVTAGFRPIATKISNNEIELSSTTGFTGDASDVEFDGIATQHDVTIPRISVLDMDAVALAIQGYLQAAGADEALVAWTETAPETGYFTITSPYRSTHAHVYPPVAFSGVTDLSAVGLPFDGTTGYTQTDGTGSGSLTLALSLRWTRVVASGQPNAVLDPTTMPVKLTRVSVGALPSTPAEFTIDLIDWDDRASGDEITNPLRTLWRENRTLSDVRYWRNRLWLFGDEWVVGSQSGDLFNFWIEDVDIQGDSDPIEVQLASDKVTVIDFALPIRDSLILFTKAGVQFEVSSPDALTPQTITSKPLTSYRTEPVDPKAMDPAVYFVANAGGRLQLLEYVYDEIALPSRAVDVSEHVPQFMPLVTADASGSRFRTIAVSIEHNMVFLLRRDKAGTDEVTATDIFVYRTRTSGPNKIQSAWSRWRIAGVRGIHDMCVIGNDLFLLVHFGTTAPFPFHIVRVGIPTDSIIDTAPSPSDQP
jgi:hypothetical protein